jgi:hypothetical protein
MYLGTIQGKTNGHRPLVTSDNLKYACKVLDIPDDKHTLRRASRAFDLYFSGKVEHLGNHTFKVASQYGNPLPYTVSISKAGISYCTCQDWMNNSGDDVYPDVHFHCKHAIAARIYLARQQAKVKYNNGSKEAAEIEAKLNGDDSNNNNGTGGDNRPSELDLSDPFQESEYLDIEQIEGRGNGDLAHKLSNGEYVISYKGIMTLAEKHDIQFSIAIHDETNTVIAYARQKQRNKEVERVSGKPINDSVITAGELAKRNAARQLIPHGEVKAMEYKAKLESEFDWEKAQKACLWGWWNLSMSMREQQLGCIIHELIRDGKLRQAHPSDYSRKEWLLIYNACENEKKRMTAVRLNPYGFLRYRDYETRQKQALITRMNNSKY